MGPLQLSDHVVQNRLTGEQMMHWDMLNKETSNLVALFKHVPARHLLSSLAILYYVIAQLQRAHLPSKSTSRAPHRYRRSLNGILNPENFRLFCRYLSNSII